MTTLSEPAPSSRDKVHLFPQFKKAKGNINKKKTIQNANNVFHNIGLKSHGGRKTQKNSAEQKWQTCNVEKKNNPCYSTLFYLRLTDS